MPTWSTKTFEDTFIYDLNPTTNYNGNAYMRAGELAGYTRLGRSLIKPDISTLPSGILVVSASLSLWTYADYASENGILGLYRLLNSYVDNEVTWNKRNATTDWLTPGGFNAGDTEQTPIGTLVTDAGWSLNQEKIMSIDPAKFQDYVNKTKTYNGFLLKMSGELNDCWDWHTTNSSATYHPCLTVNYIPGGGQPIFVGGAVV